MFTGLIQAKAEVQSFETQNLGAVLTLGLSESKTSAKGASAIAAPFSLHVGDSVSVNGVCLTATEVTKASFTAFLSAETLTKTNLNRLRPQHLVNLELPVKPSSFLGGHLVQGHIDGVGYLVEKKAVGEAWQLRFNFPRNLRSFLIEKGSIAIDGVSLTINTLFEDSEFDVMIIPHTWENTIIHSYVLNQVVNLEVDLIAKYVERSASVYFSRFPIQSSVR